MKTMLMSAGLCVGMFFCVTNVVAQNVFLSQGVSSSLPPTPSPDALRVENGFISHRVSGTVGNFAPGNTWIGTGLVNIPPATQLYGTRYQFDGSSFITSFRDDGATRNALIEFGDDANNPGALNVSELKIRYFTNPNVPSSSFDFMRFRAREQNIVVGKNTANALSSEPLFAVYDGLNPTPAANPPVFSTAAIYGVSDGAGGRTGTFSYAAGVVGDVANSRASVESYAVLGITRGRSNQWAGYFIGPTFSSGGYTTSDARLKQQVKGEESALTKLMQLKPSQYRYNTDKYADMNLETGLQHGFIAQELEKVFPEMVKEVNAPTPVDPKTHNAINPFTFKAVNYQQLHAVEVSAIQELQQEIEELKAQLTDKAGAVTVIAEDAADAKVKANSFMLAQNVPNPFTSSTVIKYSIPEKNTAMIAVMDLNGKMLLQFNNLKGASQITINGNTLQAGMYLYTLLVNGREIITKKMILTK